MSADRSQRPGATAVSLDQAAARLGVDRDAVTTLVARGRLRGDAREVAAQDVEAWRRQRRDVARAALRRAYGGA